MKEYRGWVGDSRTASTYVHLSGRNIDNALLKLNGIKTEDEVNALYESRAVCVAKSSCDPS